MTTISECEINDMNHLIQNGKLVVVQIGKYLFTLEYLRKVKDADDVVKCLEKYKMTLLKED